MKTKLSLYAFLCIICTHGIMAMNLSQELKLKVTTFIDYDLGMGLYNGIRAVGNNNDFVHRFSLAKGSHSELKTAMYSGAQNAIENVKMSPEYLDDKKPYIALCYDMHAPIPLFAISMFDVNTKQWTHSKKICVDGSTVTISDRNPHAPKITQIMCAIFNIASYDDTTANPQACALAIRELKRHGIKIILNANKGIEHNLTELLQEPETYINEADNQTDQTEKLRIDDKDNKQQTHSLLTGKNLLFGGCALALIAFLCHKFLR